MPNVINKDNKSYSVSIQSGPSTYIFILPENSTKEGAVPTGTSKISVLQNSLNSDGTKNIVIENSQLKKE
jgi:hypothetical protein